MPTHTLTLPSATLAYEVEGDGQTALVFLHGAFVNRSYWREQVTHFAPTHRVVAVDLAGHGGSVTHVKQRGPADFAREVFAVLDSLCCRDSSDSLKRVALVGHSFGADVALETAALLPPERVAAVVDVEHFKAVDAEPPAELIAGLVAGLRADFAGTAEAFARQALLTPATDAALVARLLADYARTDPAVGIGVFEAIPGYGPRRRALLASLPVPLHALHVDYSPTDEAALDRATGGRYVLRVLVGTCHYPMAEGPVALNADLEEVLAGAVTRTPPS